MTNVICKRKITRLLLGLLSIALSLAQANAQSNYSKEVQDEFSVRKSKVQMELAQLQTHEWAGEYSVHSQTLFVAPKSGFTFYMSGGDYDKNWDKYILNYGAVEFSDGKIKLIPELSSKQKVIPGFPSGLLPILWGERHYLIAADEMIEFINAVNIGYEPASKIAFGSSFLLKDGDIDNSVSGKPNIPKQYRGYLLEKPITGKIITIKNSQIEQDGSQRQRVTKVIINVGKNKGVFEGMEFLVYNPRRASTDVKVTKVEGDWSEGVIIQTYLEGKVPSVGWKISTSLKDIK